MLNTDSIMKPYRLIGIKITMDLLKKILLTFATFIIGTIVKEL